MPIIRSPSNCRAASGFRMNVQVEVFSAVVGPQLRTLPPPHSYRNQRLQGQFDRLLMMGIVMPETCWAVSVRQGNKFYDWLLHLVGCFIRVQQRNFGNFLGSTSYFEIVHVWLFWGTVILPVLPDYPHSFGMITPYLWYAYTIPLVWLHHTFELSSNGFFFFTILSFTELHTYCEPG